MELIVQTLILILFGLGLLGFIEPCTIGGHLLFLGSQRGRTGSERVQSVAVFVFSRTVVTGLFGLFLSLVGQQLIPVQTTIWALFGLVYLALGLAYLLGQAAFFKKRIDLAPGRWKRARNPLVLGIAFGLNIPACAAPIMFGLLGLAASSGTALLGFLMMAVFGLALSLPLAVAAASARAARWLEHLGGKLKRRRTMTGLVFVVLGLWSIWFGFHVDLADWA